MNTKTVIAVPEEEVVVLEKLHYEYEALKDLVASCLDIHQLDADAGFLSSPIFIAYQAQYMEKFKEYNMAKDEFATNHGLTDKNWNLSFRDREVTIG